MTLTKKCSKCGEQKELNQYYNHPRTKTGKGSQCIECQLKTSRDTYKADKHKDRRLRREYGITLAVYNDMLEAQSGGCWICGKTNELLVVDHDHETGAVRGLLCKQCNFGVGQFNDDITLLLRAVKYLQR